MKNLLVCLGLLLGGQSWAWGGSLFALKQGFASTGDYVASFDAEAAFALVPGESIALPLPGQANVRAELDRIESHPNGDRTWIGHLQGLPDIYRVFVTQGQGGWYGQILSPQGEYHIATPSGNRFAASEAQLTDVQAAGLERFLSLKNDGLIRPQDETDALETATTAPAAQSGHFSAANTVIDVMVLYTPDMTARYGAIDTLVNNLVAMSNQAYLDSQIQVTLRAVLVKQVNYSLLNKNDDALNHLSNATNSAFSDVATLRNTYGADLVALLRPVDKATSGGCGVAWVSGGGGNAISPSGRTGFSVVSYGKDIGGSATFCDNYSFTHELGHNMGSAHDRANSNTTGAYAYSYGYGISGKFGTIMSYIRPIVGKFSNPAIQCGDSPCGLPASNPLAANNALSINNTRNIIANFRAAVTTPTTTSTSSGTTGTTTTTTTTTTSTPAVPSDSDRVFNWIQSNYGGYFNPPNNSSLTLAGYYYRYYTGSNSYIGTKDGRLYFALASSGLISDLGLLKDYLAVAAKAGF